MLGASSRGHTHCFRWLCAEFNVAGLHGAPPLRLGSSALDPQGDPPESHFRVQACDAAVAYERKGSNASQLLPKPTAPSGRRWHWMRGTRSAGSTKQSRTNRQGTGWACQADSWLPGAAMAKAAGEPEEPPFCIAPQAQEESCFGQRPECQGFSTKDRGPGRAGPGARRPALPSPLSLLPPPPFISVGH